MRPRGFLRNWQPRKKSLDLLEQVKEIISEYDVALTIRQIFYRLIGRYFYPKTELAYDNLGELLVKARRAWVIPMDAIRDDGFVNYQPFFYRNVEHFMATVRVNAEDFTLNRQKGQPRRLVVMCEAAGMAPQLYRVTKPYGIGVLSAGGFDSLTDKHRLAEQWARDAQPMTVLRVGDYDPSGESMFNVLLEDIGAFAEHYSGNVEFIQVAITPEQAKSRNLPSAPPKLTDHRPRYFVDTETWQAEALDPNDLARILEDAILARFDRVIYDAVLAEEEENRQAVISRLGRDRGDDSY